ILRTLVDAIYHNELEKPLYRPPILLSGGFDAWIRRIGDEGTKWCPERSAPSKGPSWVPSDLCMPASSSNLPTPRYGQVHRVPSSELQRRRVATVLDDSKADAIRDALTAQNMAPLIAIQPLPSSRSSVYDLFRGPQYSYVGNPSYPAPGGSYADQGPPRYMPPLTQFAQARLENASATVEPVVASRRDTIFDDPLYAFTGARDALGPRSQPVNLSVISPPTKSTIDYPTVASREIASPLPSSPKPPLPQPPPVTRISKLPKRPPLPPKPEAYKGLENAPATFTPAPVAPRPSLQPVKPVTPTPTAGPSTSVIRDSYTDISVAFTQPSVGVMTNHRTMNIGTTGLKNFGYTCYMNAVIQCLVGTLPFARYFLQGNWRRDARVSGSESLSIASESRSKNLLSRPHRIASHLKLRHSGNSNSNNNKQNNGMQLVLEFSKLVDHMWSGQFTSLSPTGFKDAVGALAPQFKPNEQQDCQEFASFLLNRLHETLNRVKAQPPPTPPMTAAEETEFERLPDIAQSNRQWGQFIRRNWSIVTSIFQGQLQSRLKCLTCGQTSTTYSEFTELSVPIPISSSAAGDGGEASSSQVLANMGRNLKFTLYQCLD
ncbi:ubiquitin-specific protease doa4, partial [Spiromyces aspiralis]